MIKWTDLQRIVYDELVRMGDYRPSFEFFTSQPGSMVRGIQDLAGLYWLEGISDECPDENVKMIAHQFRYLIENGHLDACA